MCISFVWLRGKNWMSFRFVQLCLCTVHTIYSLAIFVFFRGLTTLSQMLDKKFKLADFNIYWDIYPQNLWLFNHMRGIVQSYDGGHGNFPPFKGSDITPMFIISTVIIIMEFYKQTYWLGFHVACLSIWIMSAVYCLTRMNSLLKAEEFAADIGKHQIL